MIDPVDRVGPGGLVGEVRPGGLAGARARRRTTVRLPAEVSFEDAGLPSWPRQRIRMMYTIGQIQPKDRILGPRRLAGGHGAVPRSSPAPR